jgi:hypothetical protein
MHRQRREASYGLPTWLKIDAVTERGEVRHARYGNSIRITALAFLRFLRIVALGPGYGPGFEYDDGDVPVVLVPIVGAGSQHGGRADRCSFLNIAVVWMAAGADGGREERTWCRRCGVIPF